MKRLGAGFPYNNYIGSQKVANLFKNLPFACNIKNISVNGQIRGCSGFITNLETSKVCYVTTEPFFDGGTGSGLYKNPNNAIMMRSAKNLCDYTGGQNRWLPFEKIVETAKLLTA